MNYSIHTNNYISHNLSTSARKRTIKHTLLKVSSGLALCRLGKIEYVIRPQESLWIPFDCLSALTIMPNTEITQVDLSARLPITLPKNAGFVVLSPLAEAVINRLLHCNREDDVHSHLSHVLQDEFTRLKPKLVEDELTKQVTEWQSHTPTNLDSELHYALLARESKKMQQSGKSTQHIVQTLFNDDLQRYQQIMQLYFSHEQ